MVTNMSTISWRRLWSPAFTSKDRDQPIANSDGIFGCHGE